MGRAGPAEVSSSAEGVGPIPMATHFNGRHVRTVTKGERDRCHRSGWHPHLPGPVSSPLGWHAVQTLCPHSGWVAGSQPPLHDPGLNPMTTDGHGSMSPRSSSLPTRPSGPSHYLASPSDPSKMPTCGHTSHQPPADPRLQHRPL